MLACGGEMPQVDGTEVDGDVKSESYEDCVNATKSSWMVGDRDRAFRVSQACKARAAGYQWDLISFVRAAEKWIRWKPAREGRAVSSCCSAEPKSLSPFKVLRDGTLNSTYSSWQVLWFLISKPRLLGVGLWKLRMHPAVVMSRKAVLWAPLKSWVLWANRSWALCFSWL